MRDTNRGGGGNFFQTPEPAWNHQLWTQLRMKGNLVGSGELGLHMFPGLVARHQVGEVQVLVSELPVEVVLVPQLIGLPKQMAANIWLASSCMCYQCHLVIMYLSVEHAVLVPQLEVFL